MNAMKATHETDRPSGEDSIAMPATTRLPPGRTDDSLGAMRVLVVEDEKKTALFVRKALQAEGLLVDVLHDGSEALAAVAPSAG
jgi:PleD family two-component response regulator